MRNGNGLVARLVTCAGGLALLVSPWLAWYTLSLADVLRSVETQLPAQLAGLLPGPLAADDPTFTWSGWNAVHVIRFVVLLVGLAALLSSIASPTLGSDHGGLLVPAGGLLAAVLVGYRIESPPRTLDITVGPFQFPSPPGTGAALSSLLHVDFGAWVALGGGVLVAVGGLLALANTRAAVTRPIPAPPTGPASTATTDGWTW
ncbi:MAG TPA: hypothetical protein VIJ51_00295 [Solirubrobacteraceae bacterium]